MTSPRGPMLVRATLAMALMASLALAGCTGGGDKGTAVEDKDCDLEPALCDPYHYLAGHHCITGDVHPRVYAPDTPGPDSQADPWVQGDFWRYRLTVGDETRSTELVYYDDIDLDGSGQAQHYLVGTSSRDEALDHALFSLNPMLGRIHRTLYSPHESGVHADMFHFPLCQGSTWTTTFYGAEFTMAAARQDVHLPGGQVDPSGFRITGSAGGSRLELEYSPAAKWFARLDVLVADGTDVRHVRMQLEEFGSGKGGTYHFLRAQKDEVLDVAAIPVGFQGTTVTREDGGEGPYDRVAAYLDASRASGQGWVEVHLRDPSGASKACVRVPGTGLGGNPACPASPLKVDVPYVAGDWRVTVETALLDGATTAAGEVRLVSVYDRSGTV